MMLMFDSIVKLDKFWEQCANHLHVEQYTNARRTVSNFLLVSTEFQVQMGIS